MTPQDMEIQRLRQKVKELEHIHQLDMAEIAHLRRQIGMMEQELEKEIKKHENHE